MAKWVIDFPEGPLVTQLGDIARRHLNVVGTPLTVGVTGDGEMQPMDVAQMTDPEAITRMVVLLLKDMVTTEVQQIAQAQAAAQAAQLTMLLNGVSIAPADAP